MQILVNGNEIKNLESVSEKLNASKEYSLTLGFGESTDAIDTYTEQFSNIESIKVTDDSSNEYDYSRYKDLDTVERRMRAGSNIVSVVLKKERL